MTKVEGKVSDNERTKEIEVKAVMQPKNRRETSEVQIDSKVKLVDETEFAKLK